ncbi:MAG: DUF1549 domain-containing protein [Planctomycetes bacterium]|nr:DUF1549 domain-containing protein [Planctomycetota bacterium]
MNTPLIAPWRLALLLAVGVTANAATGAELLPADRPVPNVIDHYVDRQLQTAKVAPAPQADDTTFARRLYLDLAGRIPTPAEVREYIDSTDPKKREKLVADLVASPEFIRHNANEFDAFLRNDNGDGGSVRPYLIAAFKENRSWDRMFRDLLGAGEAPHPAKPEQYVLRRLKDRDALTRDVSSVFFGLNISCAQCHNHPYLKSLTQDYFFGMREFFAASYDFQGNLLDRRFVKPAEFKPQAGAARPVKLMFLNGKTVEREGEPAADLAKAIQEESKAIEHLGKAYAKDKVLPPQAKFRAREKLADLALKPENRDLFARAMVNRLWFRFYGHGLVMRVDQMHANNPGSHPELLDWLTRDFVAHGYDLKRLLAGLVSAKAYARSSAWKGDPGPAPELFAVASVRPLTPAQWATSFQLANNPALIGRDKAFETREKALTVLENAAKPHESLIQYPRDDMPIPVNESMRLSNDPALNKTIGAQLLPTLKKATDRKAQITEAVWAVLSRPPAADEYELFESYLERRKDRPDAALQQLVWALINSPEFRFNH